MNNTAPVPALVCGEIGLVRSLGEAGIPVYVGSYYNDNIAWYSRYCAKRVQFSHSLSRDFVDRLIALGKVEGRKMAFFSDDDRAVLTFSRHREELAPYYLFNFPDHALVDAILDKRKFAALAEREGLPVPRSFMPADEAGAAAIAARMSYPCILKPSHKDDWWNPRFAEVVGEYRKAILVESEDELMVMYRKVVQIHPDVVVQEYVDGDDLDLYSVNMYLNAAGECLASFIGHKLRVYPIHAGVGSLVETVKDEEIQNAAASAVRKLGLRGHVNIQFKRDRRNRALKIMEMHTRNSLWAYLATGGGLNITAVAYGDLTGAPFQHRNGLQYGFKWIDLNKDVKALLDYRRTGEWTVGRWLSSYKGDKVFHVHSLRDPLPFLMDTWFLAKRSFMHHNTRGSAPHV
ncbi:MAG: ATP-grasp domain-containing protein [Ignavibacteriae bacterium]|nr:ATP-grasp domain-containing protein [Ignavibacteriota bacterium]